MLDGQQLYRDIIEINPPMAAFAYLPGVALARVLGVDPRYVIDAQLLLLAAASLLAVSRILRLSPALAEMKWGAFVVWAAAVVTILPMYVFAQREHIAMLTFLPALAAYALRSNREPLPVWAILIAGLGAGITLAFKPFFAVRWHCASWRPRSIRVPGECCSRPRIFWPLWWFWPSVSAHTFSIPSISRSPIRSFATSICHRRCRFR